MLVKELLPVCVTVSLFASGQPGGMFGSAIDNAGAAFVLNKMCCRDSLARHILRTIAVSLSRAGNELIAGHVHRHFNQHSDELSHALPQGVWKRLQAGRAGQASRSNWMLIVVHAVKSGQCWLAEWKLPAGLSPGATQCGRMEGWG